MRERLAIDADTLRILLEVVIHVEQLNELPAHGFKVLGYLALQPDDSADMAAVAKRFDLSDDQISRVCDKLVTLRLLRKRAIASDRRAYRVTVTEKGRGAIGEFTQATQDLMKKIAAQRLSQ